MQPRGQKHGLLQPEISGSNPGFSLFLAVWTWSSYFIFLGFCFLANEDTEFYAFVTSPRLDVRIKCDTMYKVLSTEMDTKLAPHLLDVINETFWHWPAPYSMCGLVLSESYELLSHDRSGPSQGPGLSDGTLQPLLR